MKKDKDKKKKREKRAAEPVLEEKTSSEEAEFSGGDEPLAFYFTVAGGKWKMRILWALRAGEPMRYGEIKSTVEGITDMMLSQSLRELSEAGLVTRHQFQQIPPRVEYGITESAKTLLPAIRQIHDWSAARMKQTEK